jgi:hypothetical protein
MATASFAARVRAKCRFDIDTMQPLRNASDKQRQKKERERERERERKAAGDPLMPDEEKRELKRGKVHYGDDPKEMMTEQELQNWKFFKESYLRQFPEELSSVSAQSELDMLSDLHIQNERDRVKLFKGVPVDSLQRKNLIDQMARMKEILGIHPNQVAKRTKDKAETTIAAAAARIEQLEGWQKLRARFWIEELTQIYQMYMSLSADGLTYHLDDVGLMGLTKCRTCVCPKCKTRNFVGISIDEIEGWLKEQGVLREVDPSSPDPLVPEAQEEWTDVLGDEDEDDEDAEP